MMEKNIYKRQIARFGVARGQALSQASSKSQGISFLIFQFIFYTVKLYALAQWPDWI